MRWPVLSVVVLVAALLSAGTVTGPDAAEPVKIGVIKPLTGSVAYNGQESVNGARIAAEEINAKGGVLGRPVELVVEDGVCKPGDSVNAAEKLIVRDKVPVIMGCFCSGATAAVIPVADRYQVPLVTGVSSSPALTRQPQKWFFRAAASEAMYAPAFTKYIKGMGVKTMAFAAVNDDWGRGTAKTFAEQAGALGIDLSATEFFEHGQADFYPLLTKFKNQAPNALFVIAETQDGALLMRQYRELGLKARVFAVGSLGTDTFINLAGPASEGIVVMSPYDPKAPGPRNAAFVAKYRARIKELPGKYALAGYDVIHVIAQAIARADGTDPAKIRVALEKTDHEGLLYKYDFDQMHQAFPDLFIAQIKGGATSIIDRVPTRGLKY